jgi:D-alanyl-D-alanine carboxypeptidase
MPKLLTGRILALTVALVLASLALTVGAVGAAPARTNTPRFAPATTAALTSIVSQSMAANGIPGMAVGVWIPGKGTYLHTFGVADVKTRTPFALDDHIRIASITKTFTATVILELVDRHRLKLSDRLARFVKGIPNGNRITVKEMLNMTSGIYDWTNDPKDVIAIVRRHTPSFAPGRGVEYSDSNYMLLGLIAQRVTGVPLRKLIKTMVLAPLGMRHTSYPATAAMPSPFAHGYFPQNGSLRDVTRSNPNAAGGAGALVSTLGDLKLWAKALATGTLLSRATQRLRLRTVHISSIPGKIALDYGLGIFNVNGFLGHNGAILGYGSAMFYLPSAHATFVIEGNNNDLVKTVPTEIFIQLAYYLFPKQFPNGI